jgi:hypothetical protein
MSRPVRRACGRVAIVLALAALACRDVPSVAPATPPPTPLPYPDTWRFHTEEEWVVAQTAEAIAGMVQFAAGKAMPPPLVISVVRAPLVDPLAPRRFAVKLASGAFAVDEIELHMDDHIWSADAFAPLARQLLEGGGDPAPVPTTRPSGRTTNSTLPAVLLEPRVENLERENRRVSAALATAPLDAMLHQEAALLLAAFALREVGWHFGDPRVALCLLAAHLALARLAGPDAATSSGRLAEIALDVLALRQASAVARLAAFEPASPPEEGWACALRMGATGDWRPLQRPERASLLERLIYARTLAERLDMNRAQEFLDRGGRDRVADWRRLMLGAHATLTVEACNRYRGWGLLEEEAELLAVWRLHRGSDLDPELWLEALGMDPAPSPVVAGQPQPTVRVLDLGLWMAFERRQVLSQLRWDVLCLGGLGLPEQERAVRKSSAHDYAGLETYPLVASEHNPEAKPDSAARMAAADLVRRGRIWSPLSCGSTCRRALRSAPPPPRFRPMPSGSTPIPRSARPSTHSTARAERNSVPSGARTTRPSPSPRRSWHPINTSSAGSSARRVAVASSTPTPAWRRWRPSTRRLPTTTRGRCERS